MFLDDEHFDRESEHSGHVCVSVHAVDRSGRSGRNSDVAGQYT